MDVEAGPWGVELTLGTGEPVWNAWVRLWLLSTMFNDFRHFRVIVKSLESGDTGVFDQLDESPLHGEGRPGAMFDLSPENYLKGEVRAAQAPAA